MKILFINACVREESRTLVLAREVMKDISGEITELRLSDMAIEPLNAATLAEREELLHSGSFGDASLSLARQFAEADEIVIAAPFWDLSFPSILKIYFERICTVGITFAYKNGTPSGLCRARRLTYVTTSGGMIQADYGYTYVKTLASAFFGIPETVCHRAMMLDVLGITAERLLTDAKIEVIS